MLSMAGQANKRAGYPTANAFCATGTIKYVDKVADPHYYATARIKGGEEAYAVFEKEMQEKITVRCNATHTFVLFVGLMYLFVLWAVHCCLSLLKCLILSIASLS